MNELQPAFEDRGTARFVVVRMTEDHMADAESLAALAEQQGLQLLMGILAGAGFPPSRRLIASVSQAQLRSLEARASDNGHPPFHSLTLYWRLDCRQLSVDGTHALAAALTDIPEVARAYVELPVTDPVDPTDDAFNAQQTYEDAACTGIDARWAWNQAGGDGSNAGFVDLEQHWNLDHEDLAPLKLNHPIYGDNRKGAINYSGGHGAAVLGIVVGVDNNVGVVGIAPNVRSVHLVSHFDGKSGTELHVSDAIVAAIHVMIPGDVLLLEVHRQEDPVTHQGIPARPTEIDEADCNAIRIAVGIGITVVEAAGNGGGNNGGDLDTWVDATTGANLRRGSSQFRESGAIMVAAANASHGRFSTSNYGSRIDCFALGEGVVSCGYGDMDYSVHDDNMKYTKAFKETSAASAIVAGAALVLQSMYQAAIGKAMWPSDMRGYLSNRQVGTPQGSPLTENIGVMPNLRAIAQGALGLVADVYLRDFVGDAGDVPSNGAISTSPDIIVRPAAAADPDASFGEGSGTENDDTLGERVESGQDNYVYLRIRNRGGTVARGVTGDVYWSPVATLITPSLWVPIGTTAPVDVPVGNTFVVTNALTWPSAALPSLGTHACFVAVLTNDPEDPAPRIPAATDWNGFIALIKNENNVAWRNFDVVDIKPNVLTLPIVLEFAVVGSDDEDRVFEFEIIQDLPEGVTVLWEVDPDLGRRMPAEFRRDFLARDDTPGTLRLPSRRALNTRGVILPAEARYPSRFVLRPARGLMLGTHRLSIRQLWNGLEVGRITWALRPDSDGD